MAKDNLHSKYEQLATRYLSGNASDAEVKELEEWVSADPENKRSFMAFKKAWILAGAQQSESAADTEKRWEETSARLFGEGKVASLRPRAFPRRWLAIAATVALLAVVGIALFLRPWAGQEMMVEATDAPQKIELQDGSQVILNRGSSLSYSYDKKTSVRKVELKGDAFFEVARREEEPFIVQTPLLEVEVLGTSFYVDDRAGQVEAQVAVESGRVAVRHGGQEVILEANEMAVLQGNTLEKQQVSNDNFRALKTDTLTFDNTRLEEVVATLNRHYQADIRIGSEELKDCPLTATFSNRSLEAVLLILESTFELEVRREGNRTVLRGSCEKEER